MFGTGGEIQTSTANTGLAWTRRKTGGSQIVSMADNGTTLVAVDSAGHVWTSTNATSWTDQGALVGASVRDIDYGNGLFVVGESGQVRTSSNGTSWTVRVIATASQLYNCRYCSDIGLWVAAGDGDDAIWTSPDAITWTARVSTGANNTATAVVPLPGGVLVCGWDGSVAGSGYWLSGDGATWTAGNGQRTKSFDDGGNSPCRPFELLYYSWAHEYKLVSAYVPTSGGVRLCATWS